MANTTNFNWETPDDTDLVKDGAAAIRTLGSSIDTSFVDLKGGTTGQILSKASNTDLDYTWVANDQGDITEVQAGTGISVASGTGPIPVVTNTVATTFDAKGDLIVGTGADTFAKLTVGTNGYTLVADSAETTGLKWQAAPAGGKVLQVVSATTTSVTTIATTTLTDTGITATITPTLSNSKILVIISVQGYLTRGVTAIGSGAQLLRGATAISTWTSPNFLFNQSTGLTVNQAITYLDNPSTTSATTYKLQAKVEATANSQQFLFQNDGPSTITLLEIGA